MEKLLMNILPFLIAFLIGTFSAGLVRNYRKMKKGEGVERNIYGGILARFFKKQIGDDIYINKNNSGQAVTRTKSNRKKNKKKKK